MDTQKVLSKNNKVLFEELEKMHKKMMPHKHEVNHCTVTIEVLQIVIDGIADSMPGDVKFMLMAYCEQMRCDYSDFLKEKKRSK